MTVRVLTAQKKEDLTKMHARDMNQTWQAWQAIRGLWRGHKIHAVKYQRALRRVADR